MKPVTERAVQIERDLMVQGVVHHAKRELELGRILARALSQVKAGCKCRACRTLRQLADELEG